MQAILEGLSPDGGLYMPDLAAAKPFDWKSAIGLPFEETAALVLQWFFPDIPQLPALVNRAYAGKFENGEMAPLVAVGQQYVLELFHGPTAAFKDIALSILPELLVAAKETQGCHEDITILTATSGDTGKAAMEGFRDVVGTRICVFYPEEGVSAVQKAQMVTQEGENIRVCAVKGNFDDAQTAVKQIFSGSEGRDLLLSSANSMNIGRLVPQVVYYFTAYSQLLEQQVICIGDPVDFVVPTGNFGNILAGYLAKRMGLPVGKLVCASNRNNVLTDFFNTGCYNRNRLFYKTKSPSMDILVSSNLERLLCFATGDTEFVANKMAQLNEKGIYTISTELLDRLRDSFCAYYADDEAAEKTIGKVWREHGYLCDTHTAVAFSAAAQYDRTSEAPCVILSTASPYKFPASVVKGLGQAPEKDEFAAMRQLQELTGVPIPANLQGVSEKKVLHNDSISPAEMPQFVRNLVK